MITRRDTIKTLLAGTVGAGLIATGTGCHTPEEIQENTNPLYGRSQEEQIRDQKIKAEPNYFSIEETYVLAVLIDIILPADAKSASASEAGVMDFLQFIVKDIEKLQQPLKSGIAWIDRKAFDLFEKEFSACSEEEMIGLIDLIAYPYEVLPENKAGAIFFNILRDLTLTGFYTSREGIQDLGYIGNRPNFWDGVPGDVLIEHGFEEDVRWKDAYITESGRTKVAEWDEEGNLI